MMKISSTTLLKLLTKETVEDKFIIRQFYLTDTRETLSKIIYHYEYLLPLSTNDEHENGECIPTILNHSLFDFIGHIKNQNRSMTIHCGYEQRESSTDLTLAPLLEMVDPHVQSLL